MFIDAGLKSISPLPSGSNNLEILEVGLGTGLNAFLTFLATKNDDHKINYTAIEAYPIDNTVVNKLNYVSQLKEQENKSIFEAIHDCDWDASVPLSSNFYLLKVKSTLQTCTFKDNYDLIYFDAFAPQIQPEMWTEDIFKKIYDSTKPNGRLVTYCAKGVVKRTLKKVGFIVESIPGPPGKREMVRAVKQ